jgi:hypothetical protein
MKSKRVMLTVVIGALCAIVGTAAGIAGSSAATSKSSGKAARANGHPGPPGGPLRHAGGPPVHSEEVVLNKARDGFITVTTDAGVVKSLSGNELTITEGTKTVTYKNVTVTVPGNATVDRNGSKASLSALEVGDHVVVHRSSEGTFVGAFDSQHRPRFGEHHGPPPPGAPQAP